MSCSHAWVPIIFIVLGISGLDTSLAQHTVLHDSILAMTAFSHDSCHATVWHLLY